MLERKALKINFLPLLDKKLPIGNNLGYYQIGGAQNTHAECMGVTFTLSRLCFSSPRCNKQSSNIVFPLQ